MCCGVRPPLRLYPPQLVMVPPVLDWCVAVQAKLVGGGPLVQGVSGWVGGVAAAWSAVAQRRGGGWGGGGEWEGGGARVQCSKNRERLPTVCGALLLCAGCSCCWSAVAVCLLSPGRGELC